MNQAWQDFLQQNGATIEQGITADFSGSNLDFRQIEQSTILVDLSHRGLIKVSGEEARDFLQGQFCNDVNHVDARHSQLSAYCTPKGRILASFRLLQSGDDYFMSMSADVLEATLKRLRMFVMRSKVTLDDVSQETVQIGLCGPKAADLLTGEFDSLPVAGHGVAEQNGITCIRINSSVPRFELLGNPAAMQPLWQKLAAASQPVASHYWDWLDIQDGIPTVTAPVVEAFVPQMVNLHWIDGLSFKKGCYPGQELVERMDSRGADAPQSVRILDVAPGSAIGDPVVDADGSTVGTITSVSPDGTLALALVRRGADVGRPPVHLR